MTSFRNVPKVPLLFLISAAERAKRWRSMKMNVVGEATDNPIKISKFATEYHPHPPYSHYGVLRNHHFLFLAYARSVDDEDVPDVSPELLERRVYSISFFNAYYSEREDSPNHQIRNVWQKVDGLYRLRRE